MADQIDRQHFHAELLELHALDGDEVWLDAARALARLYTSTPVGPNGVRYLRPDLPGWRRQIWVDSMDGGPPFLARLARVTGEERHADEAGAYSLNEVAIIWKLSLTPT